MKQTILKSVCRFLHSLVEKFQVLCTEKVFVDQIKHSDWLMVSSNEHMNHGCVRPELDRSKISKQAYSHCKSPFYQSMNCCHV